MAKDKGLGGRVLSKVNARGDLVIALVVPQNVPGEWGDPTPEPSKREEKRASRERR